MEPTRRTVLKVGALGLAQALLPGCTATAQEAPATPPPPPDPYQAYGREPAPQGGGGGGYGATTSADIEGPFYRPEAPFQSRLAPAGEPGRRLRLRGRVVMGVECTPRPGAVVDVWQANAAGRYDNDDPRRPPQGFHLRGRIRADAQGCYEVETVWPGHYSIGRDRWRPAHLHVKATADGCAPLTTQLYFAGDPHNAADPWYDATRELAPVEADGVWTATYELVLARARPGR